MLPRAGRGIPTARLAQGAPAAGRVVLLRGLDAARALVEGGVSLADLNVGNLAWSPGARRVVRAIALTAADIAVLDTLAERGVRIAFQPTPDDPALSWAHVRRRLGLG